MEKRMPNGEQRSVIDETEQNIILFASAGTGKTFSVAQRVNRIIRTGTAGAEDILCLTFTVKACQEMKDDILTWAGEAGKKVSIYTIHGFCYQMLREEAKRTGAVYSEPAVYDEVDADWQLKESIRRCALTDEDVMESSGVLYQLMCLLKKERELQGRFSSNEAEDYQKHTKRWRKPMGG